MSTDAGLLVNNLPLPAIERRLSVSTVNMCVSSLSDGFVAWYPLHSPLTALTGPKIQLIILIDAAGERKI